MADLEKIFWSEPVRRRAFQLLRRVIELDDRTAAFYLAMTLINFEEDRFKGVIDLLLARAAASGNSHAAFVLAERSEAGLASADPTVTFVSAAAAARKRRNKSDLYVLFLNSTRFGEKPDVGSLLSSANSGYGFAVQQIAELEDRKPDRGDREAWLKRGADIGLRSCALLLAFEETIGESPDYGAVYGLYKSASTYSAEAQYHAGQMHFFGQGVEQDLDNGLKSINYAARRGSFGAAWFLAQSTFVDSACRSNWKQVIDNWGEIQDARTSIWYDRLIKGLELIKKI